MVILDRRGIFLYHAINISPIKRNRAMGQKIAASIIIGTYNRSDLLRRALESLVQQTLGPDSFEVIVINDGSDDGTLEMLKEFGKKHSNIHIITTETNLGLSSARNQGLAAASGNCILFLDDDCIAKRDWVEKMCGHLAVHSAAAGAIDSPRNGWVKLSHNIAHFHPFMPGRRSGPIDFMAGANMGFRRQVLEELHGFDKERKLAGDTQLCLKARSAGYQPYLTQEAGVVHDPAYITWAGAVKSSYAHARTTILLRDEFRSLLRTPFILRSPLLLRLFSPVIALKVTAGIYLRNPGLLRWFWTIPLVWLLKLTWCWGAASGLKDGRKGDQDRGPREQPHAAA